VIVLANTMYRVAAVIVKSFNLDAIYQYVTNHCPRVRRSSAESTFDRTFQPSKTTRAVPHICHSFGFSIFGGREKRF